MDTLLLIVLTLWAVITCINKYFQAGAATAAAAAAARIIKKITSPSKGYSY